MRKIKNISEVKKTIVGVGVFLPGDEKEVEDSVANQYENIKGWEVSDSKRKKAKTFFSSEETKNNPENKED